uniref:Activator of Hsp90 ATPase AHSA1-like N-terminal domain-containing protein n=1 Tax=Arcella intermedia TaxID=1963864 RepID=A0A6B2L9Y9_9EUKA|eukprot:TRINITY_DN1058_c0_g1_i1.p1 TRINITY_DN1058_c0_g1~~TRINITY_DN1058_c0_g1_i1.p1  ORF type:complete len:329 (-),score=75.82 TRINITY_DN1058_c0_g1_i1:69-1055(-)
MARLGQGDSRWIVDNRRDGKNVDNWHWTEKDLFPWAEDRLKQKFAAVAVPAEKAELTIEKVESVTGSMIVCNRKGKTIYIFDVQLKLEWSGKLKGTEEEVSGKGSISVENIANDEDKWKWSIKLENETAQNKALKEELRLALGPVLDANINIVLEEMMGSSAVQYQTPEKKTDPKPTETKPQPTQEAPQGTQKVSTKNFVQKLTFEVPPYLIYETLLDPARVSAFTGGPAKVENKVGSEFSVLDGVIQGKQVELVHPKKIVQTWRFNTWPKEHFSTVTLAFDGSSSSTDITLSHQGIPASDYDRTCKGWETFYWQRIRGMFGFSYKLN